jgi:hypothetical protein
MHSVLDLEEKTRRRYHQLKGVEQFGIEPVPDIGRRCSCCRHIFLELERAARPGNQLAAVEDLDWQLALR